MANPSTVAAQQRLELWRMKLEVAGMAQEGMFDRGFVHRKIFGLNDKQIAAIKDGKRIDKLEDAILAGIEAPQTDVPSPDDGGGTSPPPDDQAAPPEAGAEELPNTLGGPGGEPGSAQEPQNSSFARSGPSMVERFNPGSGGSRAELAVDRGKDLFSTGEDPFKLSFGTEKQTASDPNDRRAAHRMITRPFSEESVDDMPGMEQVEESDEFLESVSRWLRQKGHA